MKGSGWLHQCALKISRRNCQHRNWTRESAYQTRMNGRWVWAITHPTFHAPPATWGDYHKACNATHNKLMMQERQIWDIRSYITPPHAIQTNIIVTKKQHHTWKEKNRYASLILNVHMPNPEACIHGHMRASTWVNQEMHEKTTRAASTWIMCNPHNTCTAGQCKIIPQQPENTPSRWTEPKTESCNIISTNSTMPWRCRLKSPNLHSRTSR